MGGILLYYSEGLNIAEGESSTAWVLKFACWRQIKKTWYSTTIFVSRNANIHLRLKEIATALFYALFSPHGDGKDSTVKYFFFEEL